MATPENTAEQPQSQAKDTPRHVKEYKHRHFSLMDPRVGENEFFESIADETVGHHIGPMPIKMFFKSFMPWRMGLSDDYKDADPCNARKDRLRSMATAKNEAQMNKIFVRIFLLSQSVASTHMRKGRSI